MFSDHHLGASCDLAVIGGGAAGMMAAVAASAHGTAVCPSPSAVGDPAPTAHRRIVLFEKNPRAGLKVLVCGGGRCNFTNAGSREFLIAQFGRNGRFLTPALNALDNEALRRFFDEMGVPSHVEHDGKVYPDSHQARSVVDALLRRMEDGAVEVRAGRDHAVMDLQRNADGFRVRTAGGEVWAVRCVILAVGGMSYQRMGTVGDGYRMAAALGHTIITPRPAIVGLLVRQQWVGDLRGTAVRGVRVAIDGGHSHARGGDLKSHGDMLFTHFGLSGPAILNPSQIVAELLERSPAVTLRIDFAPSLTHDALHALLRRWQREAGRRRVRTMLSQGQPAREEPIRSTSPDQTFAPPRAEMSSTVGFSVPMRLADTLCRLEEIPEEQVCARLTSAQMHRLVARIKACSFEVIATRGFQEAMVTAGGVKLSEVDPQTMESRLVPGLFVVGEVLDLTGPSGGYNLQLAFSTGHLAGMTVRRRLCQQI